MGVPPNRNHQADNLAKLWQEFLSMIELIAKIFGAVSRTISLMRLSALLASKRCRCRDDGFCSGVGVPPNRNHQADNLAKLWQEFLSMIELIAKIFGAVSRTISLMRLSALLASKRCRCRDDGFCSGVGVPPKIIHYSLLILH